MCLLGFVLLRFALQGPIQSRVRLLERLSALRLLPLLLLLAPLRLQLVLLMLLLLELARVLLLLVLLVRLLQQLLLLVLEVLLLLLPLLAMLIVGLLPRQRPAARLRQSRGTMTSTMTRSSAVRTQCTMTLTDCSKTYSLYALLLQHVPLLPPLVSNILRLRSLQRLLALQRFLRVVMQLVLVSIKRRLLQGQHLSLRP